jgi:hypothetical protein
MILLDKKEGSEYDLCKTCKEAYMEFIENKPKEPEIKEEIKEKEEVKEEVKEKPRRGRPRKDEK